MDARRDVMKTELLNVTPVKKHDKGESASRFGNVK
jgi:hypothetical protein